MAKAPRKPRLDPKADLGVIIKLAGYGASTSGVGDNVATTAIAALKDIRIKLEGQTRRVSNAEVEAALLAGRAAIVADLQADIARFARHAATAMFKFKSPDTPMRTKAGTEQRVTISIDDVNRGLASSVLSKDPQRRTARDNALLARFGNQSTVVWRALSYRTLRNKRSMAARGRLGDTPTSFFIQSGDLYLYLSDFLPKAFTLLLDPQVHVRQVVREDGKTVQRATVSLMTKANPNFVKQGLSVQNLPALGGRGSVTSGANEDVFVRYLRQAGVSDNKLAAKLENPLGSHRPFLQNLLAYWILRRLPVVLRRSVEKVLVSAQFRRSYIPGR